LQLEPSTRVTQPHVGFSAHSDSQLQAPPPLAFSSQYQPAGQMPLPHKLQVPSSQLGPFDFSEAGALELDSPSSVSASALAWSCDRCGPSPSSAADFGSPPVALGPPHWGNSQSRAKQQKMARIVGSVYVP
jgi:hypothetical protein